MALAESFRVEKWVDEIHEQWSHSPTLVVHSIFDINNIPFEVRQKFYDELRLALETLYPNNEIEIAMLVGEIRVTRR